MGVLLFGGVAAGCRGLLSTLASVRAVTERQWSADIAPCGCHDWFHELGVHMPRKP